MVRWYSMRVRDTRATQRPTVTRGCVAVRGWFHTEWRSVRFGRTRRDARLRIHPSIRSSLSFSRSIHARFRVDYARRAPAHVRTAIVRFHFDRRALYPSIVKLCIIKHHARANPNRRLSSTRDATRPDERRATTIESEGKHTVGGRFRAENMTTKRATTEIRTTMKRIESTRAHCARVVEKLTASGESGDVAVARRAKVRSACVMYRCDSRRAHVDGGMCAHGMVWSTLG